ncbi:DinB family protein [Streptomyces noursei]|uniref:DinB family protein n=1 Tax=Streptomyces noursei TaxID=1971 RepID=UPI001679CF26|nr:DinB family protein [Streptomyces noursei]MCZ1019042.1 DinB family protein [Streptomyces noursei]GGX31142.1 hypothetical protein GCM10010341_60710 [Streptomyces noursei]
MTSDHNAELTALARDRSAPDPRARTDWAHELDVYAGTAAAALDQIDRAYDNWSAGMCAATTAELDRLLGPSAGPFTDRPLAVVVLHVNREVVHHGAEIALLRDLYAHGCE